MEAFSSFIWMVTEPFLPILAIVVGTLLAGLIVKGLHLIGVKVEEKHLATYQTGITNAALEAVRRMGGPSVATTVSNAAIDAAVQQMMDDNPDAVKALKATEAGIARRVEAQATAIVQSTPAVIEALAGAAGHAAIDAGLASILRGRRTT